MEQSLLFDLLKYRSKAGTNRMFFPENIYFCYACATCSELPSNISTMGVMAC